MIFVHPPPFIFEYRESLLEIKSFNLFSNYFVGMNLLRKDLFPCSEHNLQKCLTNTRIKSVWI